MFSQTHDYLGVIDGDI